MSLYLKAIKKSKNFIYFKHILENQICINIYIKKMSFCFQLLSVCF